MEPAIQQIKVCKALRLVKQFVGHGSRASLYRWMEALQIEPVDGLICESDLALLCVWGKALSVTGSKRAAARATLDAKSNWTETELYEFAFSPTTTFQQVGEKYAS
jgi:hypothetical protein